MEEIVCYQGVVHPWLCDAMGHLTTRNYVAMFDDASYHLYHAVGYSASHRARDIGVADIRNTISYKAELTEGDLVVVRAKITSLGSKSITSVLRMFDIATGKVAAEMETVSVQFDLKHRTAIPVCEDIRGGYLERSQADSA